MDKKAAVGSQTASKALAANKKVTTNTPTTTSSNSEPKPRKKAEDSSPKNPETKTKESKDVKLVSSANEKKKAATNVGDGGSMSVEQIKKELQKLELISEGTQKSVRERLETYHKLQKENKTELLKKQFPSLDDERRNSWLKEEVIKRLICVKYYSHSSKKITDLQNEITNYYEIPLLFIKTLTKEQLVGILVFLNISWQKKRPDVNKEVDTLKISHAQKATKNELIFKMLIRHLFHKEEYKMDKEHLIWSLTEQCRHNNSSSVAPTATISGSEIVKPIPASIPTTPEPPLNSSSELKLSKSMYDSLCSSVPGQYQYKGTLVETWGQPKINNTVHNQACNRRDLLAHQWTIGDWIPMKPKLSELPVVFWNSKNQLQMRRFTSKEEIPCILEEADQDNISPRHKKFQQALKIHKANKSKLAGLDTDKSLSQMTLVIYILFLYDEHLEWSPYQTYVGKATNLKQRWGKHLVNDATYVDLIVRKISPRFVKQPEVFLMVLDRADTPQKMAELEHKYIVDFSSFGSEGLNMSE